MKKTIVRYAMNILLVCTSVLIMLGMAEIALRFTRHKSLLPMTQVEPLRNYLKADPAKGYDIRENAAASPATVDGLSYDIWSNELGCFDMPYQGEKDPVLLVGDSFTFAFAPFRDKWGTKLENLLGRRVLKCGVGGYGTRQELLKASQVASRLNQPPRLIVVGYFVNDLEDDYLFPNATILDGYPVRTQFIKSMETGEIVRNEKSALEQSKRYGVKEYPHNFLLKQLKWRAEQQSIIYHLAKQSLRPVLLTLPLVRNVIKKTAAIAPPTLAFSDRPWLDQVWSEHFVNLREFKALADRQGSGLLVVIIPSREQVYPFLTSWQGMDRERPQKTLGRFFGREGIHHMDALPLLQEFADQSVHRLRPDRDLYWRNDPHLNVRGNDLLALLVSRYILEHDLLVIGEREQKQASIAEKLEKFRERR